MSALHPHPVSSPCSTHQTVMVVVPFRGFCGALELETLVSSHPCFFLQPTKVISNEH